MERETFLSLSFRPLVSRAKCGRDLPRSNYGGSVRKCIQIRPLALPPLLGTQVPEATKDLL